MEKVIDEKYGTTPINTKLGSTSLVTAKGPWKAILKHCSLILGRIYYKLGNGEDISFYKENWLEDDSLDRNFLYSLNSLKKDGAVRNM